MRVLHLRSTQGVYGAERALIALATASLRVGVESILYALGTDVGARALVKAARDGGAPAIALPASRTGADAIAQLASEVRRLSPSVLHAHDYKALFVGGAVSRLTGTPMVATFHGDTGENLKVRGYELFARLLARGGAARIAAPSSDLAGKLARLLPRERVCVIPNGVRASEPCSEVERAQARAELGLSRDAPVFAIVARLTPEKGHAVLIQALRSMEAPPTVLCAGSGPLEHALRRESEGLPIQWLGYRADVRPVYAAADALVLPSLREGLPLVVLDAMAWGRPVIATAVGELPQVLGAGRGVLVPPQSPAALAKAVRLLETNVEERLRVAERAREYVGAELGIDRMARRYRDEVYLPALSPVARSA